MGLKVTCDSCHRIIVFSHLYKENDKYLCATCVSHQHSAARYYCNTCHNYSSIAMRKGNPWIELVLYLLYIFPGIIYTFWRRWGPPNLCPTCRSGTLVPAWAAQVQDVPATESALSGKPPSQGTPTKKCPACAEIIMLEAIKCRFCGEKFDPSDVAREVAQYRNRYTIGNRIICSDGNCIGVIGPDGRCKVCGRAGMPPLVSNLVELSEEVSNSEIMALCGKGESHEETEEEKTGWGLRLRYKGPLYIFYGSIAVIAFVCLFNFFIRPQPGQIPIEISKNSRTSPLSNDDAWHKKYVLVKSMDDTTFKMGVFEKIEIGTSDRVEISLNMRDSVVYGVALDLMPKFKEVGFKILRLKDINSGRHEDHQIK